MQPSPTLKYAGTAASASGAGGVWTNPGNATGPPDATYTSGNITAGNTNNLVLTNFGFAIPATAVIDGILVEFDRYGTNAETASVQLLKAGTAVGTAKTLTDLWPAAESFFGVGGSSDLWGTTWASTDTNNTNFGVEISAGFTHDPADALAFIDAVRITIYWHTAPTAVPKRYIYKVYNQGTYVGNLPTPTSEFAYTQDINTGGSQITVTCPTTIDTSKQANSILLDETGAAIQDESSNNILDEGAVPIVGLGTSGTSTMIRNGNKVVVWEFGYWHPNGKVVFSGQIQHWEASYGGDNMDEQVMMIIYSDGNDLSNFPVVGSGTLFADQVQTSQNDSFELGTIHHVRMGQTVTVGAGVTNLAAIDVQLSVTSAVNPHNFTLMAFNSVNDYFNGIPAIGTATLSVNATSPTTYKMVFASPASVTPGQQFFFFVTSDSTNTTDDSFIFLNDSNYSGGNMYFNDDYEGTGWLLANPNALYFKTYYTVTGTIATFVGQDPTTGILTNVLGTYISQGGSLNYSSASIQATGLLITYEFNTNSVYEALQAMLSVSPNGFYYYVDLGTDTLYFLRANNVADFKLTKGYHIQNLTVVATIEQMVNTTFFTGGDTGGGNNLYTFNQDPRSVALYGQFMDRPINSLVTDTSTAAAIAESEIAELGSEQFSTQVTVMDHTVDLTLLKPGLVIGFNGFGTFVDGMLAQIVRVDYTPSVVTLTLGLLPKRLHTVVEQVTKAVVGLSTLDNPSTPS